MYSLSESIAAKTRMDQAKPTQEQNEQKELMQILIDDGVPECSEVFLQALQLFQKPACRAQFKHIQEAANRIKYIEWTWAHSKANSQR
jgi:hypothetical protein